MRMILSWRGKGLRIVCREKELSATETRTRRYDVLADILNANNYEAIGEQRAEEAKRLLSNYSGMTPN